MKTNGIVFFVMSILLLASTASQAAQVKFSIVPVGGSLTTFLLPSNFTETVSYLVTNQTSVTRTLTMVPLAGVSQNTSSGGVCPSPFVLSPHQSCILSLVINGSQIPASGISAGPTICKTMSANDTSPDPFLCSDPDISSMLAVSVTSSGQHAYVADQISSSVTYCQVNPASGLFSQCAVTATGLTDIEGVGFNPAGTLFYSANPGNSTISVCQVNNTTGALSGCVNAGGSGFDFPDAVSFSPDGSIFYTSNFNSGSVSACLVNPTTGMLSSCVTNTDVTFVSPGDMTVNSAGTFAYVVNRVSNTVSVCNVSGQVVNSCNNLSGSNISNPEGVTLDASNLHAYITNAVGKSVTVCDILQDGTGLLANCFVTGGEFAGTGNLGLNNVGTVAYVPNTDLSRVFACNVSQGQLSDCFLATSTGFSGAAGVVLR